MKNQVIAVIALLALSLAPQLGLAQIVITQVGTQTSGGTMPGSPSDYVIFNSSNYPTTGAPNVPGSATNLNSFSIIGGEHSHDGTLANSSQIAPPGSITSIQSGDILSPNTIAIGLEVGSNPSFNYNNFNVYVMFSNAPGLNQNDTSIALDGRINGVEQPATSIGVTDNNSNLSSAYYVEFNVTGLASTIAANPGPGPSDLVLRAFGGLQKDIGGVSFESISDVPEPSTYALMIGGLAVLGFCVRRKGALAK